MSIWSWLKLTAALWFIRKGFKVAGWLLIAAAAIAAWPLTTVAALGYLAAWLRGWPPARLWQAGAWALPMTAVYAIGQALRLHAWQTVGLAPVDDWGQAWRLLAGHSMLRAALLVAPVAVPAGLAVAGLLWAWRIYAITTGLAGLTASAPIEFDARQWRRQERAARGRAAAPGSVPLVTRAGRVVIGATIRTVRHPWRPILAVPYRSFARHSVIVGSSGSGKTNLMMRLWAGWYAAAHTAYARREGNRPLLVVLDCKGGPDARVKAERTRRLLHGVGARRVAIWPDDARLCLWDLPPRDLGVLLLQMIETGTGAAAYYTDIMQAVVNLALAAPGGPPPNAASFLDRLDVAWLEAAYGDGLHEAALTRIRAAKNHVGDIQLRYATLLGRLGRPWTVPAPWTARMPGTASWKAPGNNPSPKPRPWRSPKSWLTPLRPRTLSGGRSCSPPTTTPPCPAGCPSPTSTNAAGPSASACRSRPNPGKASAAMTTSDTGSPPPPTAASG